MPAPIELLWAFVGLILTIGGTFLPAFVANPSVIWDHQSLQIQPLGVTYQIGAVLLIGCIGGKNAAILSQIAYLVLGLTLLPVFTQGGGLAYLQQPTFGYLLGFIPGAWICGWLAFKVKLRLESLAFSCLCGLISVHLIGLSYLTIAFWLKLTNLKGLSLPEAILKYSVYPLPGQLAIVCAVTVIGFFLRRIMSC
ncbi:MAG: biotin transporter BioY [Microcoleaceae cyanobacterium]